jgi:hypothetical protein
MQDCLVRVRKWLRNFLRVMGVLLISDVAKNKGICRSLLETRPIGAPCTYA